MKRQGVRLSVLSVFTVLSVLCVLTAFSSSDAPVVQEKDFAGQPTYKVTRIIDGDTVELMMDGKATTVRMIGVDTPETVHPSKPVEHYGKEASMFTVNLLKGEEVYIEREPGNTVGKYGRTLLYLYRAPDGLFVNLEIIRQGYGHAYTNYPFQYMGLFQEYEERARKSGKGLWTNPAIVYITKTGSKYHVDGCRYLRKSKIPIKLTEAAKRYEPCSVCKPPQASGSSITAGGELEETPPLVPIVYVYTTRTGKRYHKASCRWGYTKVTLAKAKQSGLTPCQVCRPTR